LRKTGKKFLAKIVGADVDVDFAFGGGVQIAGADDFAVLDEDHGIAGDFDFAEKMRVEKNSGAALSLVADDVADEAAAHGVEAGGGFVEEDEIRFVDESLGEADALHHALGKAAEPAVRMRSEADEIEIGGDAIAKLRGSKPGETAVEREEFARGEPVVKTKIFGKEADFAADFDIGERAAENLRATAGGLYEAEEHFD